MRDDSAGGTDSDERDLTDSPPESGMLVAGDAEPDKPSHERGSPAERTDFLWRSIGHLEGRISSVDSKANILMGLVLAVVGINAAVVVRLNDSPPDTVVLLALSAHILITVVLAYLAMASSLRALRPPRQLGPEFYPSPYVVWPVSAASPAADTRQRPSHDASDVALARGRRHTTEVLSLSEPQVLDNLAAMQTTLILLVRAKYAAYRTAVRWIRLLIGFELGSVVVALVVVVTSLL